MFFIRMFLSLVIERHHGVCFPTLKAGCVIKPVLVEHWKDIIFDDLSEPFVSTDITGAEIAVSYAEAFAKCLVISNLIIQFLDS